VPNGQSARVTGAPEVGAHGEPRVAPPAPPPTERAGMVGWFDPGQLFVTGVRVVISRLFGQNADRRILDAVVQQRGDVCDYSAADELWVDYVADTGDGWNSTYGVAYHVAQPALALGDPAGALHETRRGEVLVFGGDEVYPTPSRDAYEQRLVAPYRTALAASAPPHPSVFAVPGNHDWYDSLVSFTRLFCGSRRRWFGGWQTRQTLSYFAIKLPHGWWLVGTDVQLDSDIDDPQLDYFRQVAARMAKGDRVILCTAEPHWITEARYARFDPTASQRNLEFLEHEVFKDRIEVFLSGDLHHYRRHAAPDGRQKITAGGGGAFLVPTHHDEHEVAEVSDGFVCVASFPHPEDSRRLAWRNLLFPYYNPKFGVITAILYLLLGWSVQAPVAQYDLSQVGAAVGALRDAVLRSPVAVYWGLLVLFGFYYFTDTHSPRYRFWGGLSHGVAHLAAAFFVGWGSAFLAAHAMPHAPHWQHLLLTGACLLAGGYVVGAELMGVYLLVSLNGFGRHNTEAFSSLRCEDFKSWVRLHVTPEGALRIYPIKLRRVARRWRAGAPTADASGERRALLVPDDPRATPPALIEAPITVARRG
jgi:hypothetical protein